MSRDEDDFELLVSSLRLFQQLYAVHYRQPQIGYQDIDASFQDGVEARATIVGFECLVADRIQHLHHRCPAFDIVINNQNSWCSSNTCLLYTSDAADERSSVDLG